MTSCLIVDSGFSDSVLPFACGKRMTPSALTPHLCLKGERRLGSEAYWDRLTDNTLREGYRSLDGSNWFLSLNYLETE